MGSNSEQWVVIIGMIHVGSQNGGPPNHFSLIILASIWFRGLTTIGV